MTTTEAFPNQIAGHEAGEVSGPTLDREWRRTPYRVACSCGKAFVGADPSEAQSWHRWHAVTTKHFGVTE